MQENSRQVRVGDYVVLGRWATGGMAHVYVARKPNDSEDRLYAIKTLRPEYAQDDQYRDMFATEAHVAALWSHTNVVETREVIRDKGRLFIVMEFVLGETLRSVIETAKTKGRLPVVAALEITERLASALASAHALRDERGRHLGLIHRDVCPANVLVDYDGHVKLLDFGIAKAALRTQSTQGLQVKGHISYVSPEQAAGARDIDARTDIYSLGLVLWELLTLKPALVGASDSEILSFAVQGKIPAPSSAGSEAPPGLDAIVLRALARERKDRYATATDFAKALERYRKKHFAREASGAAVIRGFMTQHFADKHAEDRALVASWDRASRESVPERVGDDAAPTELGAARPASALPRVGNGEIPVPLARAVSDALESVPSVNPSQIFRSEPSGSIAPLLNRSTSIPAYPASLEVEVPTRVRERVFLVSTIVLAFALAFSTGLLITRTQERLLHIDSEPPGAEVRIDGQLVGRSPLEISVRRDAPVNVVLQAEGYEVVHLAIGRGNEPMSVSGKLEKLGTSAAREGMCKTDLRPPAPRAELSHRDATRTLMVPETPIEPSPASESSRAEPMMKPVASPRPVESPKAVGHSKPTEALKATDASRPKGEARGPTAGDRLAELVADRTREKASVPGAPRRASSREVARSDDRIAPKSLTIAVKELENRPSLSTLPKSVVAEPSRAVNRERAPEMPTARTVPTDASRETAPKDASSDGAMRVELGRATVIGRVDTVLLDRTLSGIMPAIRACYASDVGEGTRFSGKLRIQIGITTSGQIDSVTTNMLGSKSFRICVESAVSEASFPKAEIDRALVFVPVRLDSP